MRIHYKISERDHKLALSLSPQQTGVVFVPSAHRTAAITMFWTITLIFYHFSKLQDGKTNKCKAVPQNILIPTQKPLPDIFRWSDTNYTFSNFSSFRSDAISYQKIGISRGSYNQKLSETTSSLQAFTKELYSSIVLCTLFKKKLY